MVRRCCHGDWAQEEVGPSSCCFAWCDAGWILAMQRGVLTKEAAQRQGEQQGEVSCGVRGPGLVQRRRREADARRVAAPERAPSARGELRESLRVASQRQVRAALRYPGQGRLLPVALSEPRPDSESITGTVPVHLRTFPTANATRQDFPPASDTVHTAGAELWQWDMLDMGADNATIDGNSYATLILVKHTRFLMVFLHTTKTGEDVERIMLKARAKIGSWPAITRSNGAAEYNSPEIQKLFVDNHIDHQWSNAEQQFQNAASKSVVNMLGRSVLVLLLTSGMPPEFWGLAMMQVLHVYNYLPHSSINFEILYALQTGRVQDNS
eukprot:2877946-Rhodomonas_salina.2